MKSVRIAIALLFAFTLSAAAQTVTITSPTNNSTQSSAVTVNASTNSWITSDHLEVWDTNFGQKSIKLGNVFAGSMNTVFVLPNGTHTTTVNVVTAGGSKISSSTVKYTVAEKCIDSSTTQCNFDQLGIGNPDTSCYNKLNVPSWIGDACSAQGRGSHEPLWYGAAPVLSFSPIPDTGNTSLNGMSLLLSETQVSSGYSNVIFSSSSPTQTKELDSNWTLDLYVYIPNPLAHQAIEFDMQYVWGGYWTKFYTECAFNVNNGTGYWAVYGGGNGWTFLDGTNGAPKVPCDRSQFSAPLTGGPSSTGFHHIVWTFTRNTGGYAEYKTLTFDGTTYQLNYTPTTDTNGGSNQGDFSALIQLDGASGSTYPTVQAYVNELNITHTP